MLKLTKMNLDEINSKPFLINHILDLYNEVNGDYFKYELDGEERYLYRIENYYTIMALDGEYLLYTNFCLDDEYNPNYIELDGFYASYMDGQLWTWDDNSGNLENISVVRRAEEANNDGYSGLIVYSQVNLETNEKMFISYKNQYREDKKIYSCNLSTPFVICFLDKKDKKEQYMLLQTDYQRYSYDLLTIKEYGLSAFLENGAYSLQKERSIERYFKVKGQLPNGTCLLMVPFSKQFTKDEIFNKVEEKGFKKDVSEYLFDFYNGNYEECSEILELANAIKQYDLENVNELKLNLK